MHTFWLTLNRDTFIWTKGDKGIVYNSKNYTSFTFSSLGNLKDIYKELTDPDNLYGTGIDSDLLKDKSVGAFIENILHIQAGSFIEKKSDEKRPVSYMPVLKIQDDMHALRLKHKAGRQTYEILRNLSEITIHINGNAEAGPWNYKQFTAPSNSKESLSAREIKIFVNKCCKEYIIALNLVGDFSTYTEREQLFEWIRNTKLNRYNLVAGLKSVLSLSFPPEWFHKGGTVHLTVIADNPELLEKTDLTRYLHGKKAVTFCFPVTSAEEYKQANLLIKNKCIRSFEIIPVYNGNNIDFFQQYVYTTRNDILSPGFNKREIFSNQAINRFFFGKLIILPDKKVYANVNAKPIGEMKDSIYALIFKELDKGLSWRLIRNKKPCTECLYQWLCPSPSNYELLIGKPDLCHIAPG